MEDGKWFSTHLPRKSGICYQLNNIMKNIVELIEKNYEEGKLKDNISFIQKKIFELLNQIKATNSINEAIPLFKDLERIQYILAKAVFKDNLIVTPAIKKFISDFDRVDDEEMKIFLYLKIKQSLE